MIRGFDRTPELDPYVQSRGEEIAVGVERAAAFLQSASRDAGHVGWRPQPERSPRVPRPPGRQHRRL